MENRLQEIIGQIPPVDQAAMNAAADRQNQLTKPQGALGILEELSIRVAGMQGKARPAIENKVIFTMAADHGVASEGVSPYPAEVTPQMVLNFLHGGAGINVIARQIGAKVIVSDIGVNYDFPAGLNLNNRKIAKGTANLAAGPAMTREQAVRSIMAGIETVMAEPSLDILGTGDMGIGNTTPSTAIAAVLTGRPVEELTGRGAGLDDKGLEAKMAIIRKALAVNQPDPSDPIGVLAKVGGFEIGAIAGAIIGGAARRVPVAVDGFISGAGALIAHALAPRTKDYMIMAHQSVEIGHKRIMEHIGLKPLLSLDLRLGEGTGAALGIFMIQTAVAVLNEMATFAEAGVSDKEN